MSPPLPGRPRRRRAPGVEGVDDRAPGAPLVAAPPVPSPPLSLSLSSPASMARWRIWRPRSRAVPFLSLLLLAPLVFTVSRLHLSWSPEKGLCLPPPAAPEGRRQCLPPPTAPRLPRPDRLVLGPAAGQGRPDRLQCQGFLLLPRPYSPSVCCSVAQMLLGLDVAFGRTMLAIGEITYGSFKSSDVSCSKNQE